MNKINMKRKYRTKDGDPVRILCTDRVGRSPVVGLINFGQFEKVYYWSEFGEPDDPSWSGVALVEVPLFDDIKIDEPIIYDEDGTGFSLRGHFAGVVDGFAMVWSGGRTSFTTTMRDPALRIIYRGEVLE